MQFRTHGGKRPGAGRKAVLPGRARLRHEARPEIAARFPVHVTKRVRRDVTRLRRFELCKVLRAAFVLGCRRGEFRICQFSIQGNHLHLICEASDAGQLARGIQGWSVRVARGLNGYLGRTGAVFDDRYHLEILTTPTQTRHALCYVLRNASHYTSMGERWLGATVAPMGRSALWALVRRARNGRGGVEHAVGDLAAGIATATAINLDVCGRVRVPQQANA